MIRIRRPRSAAWLKFSSGGLVNSGKKVDSSNRSLKRVELLVLELEKILTQFQILSPSPKQKQLKYK